MAYSNDSVVFYRNHNFYPFLGDLLRPQIMMKNRSGAWYAEAVDWALIRMLEKIKTLQGFKKFSG